MGQPLGGRVSLFVRTLGLIAGLVLTAAAPAQNLPAGLSLRPDREIGNPPVGYQAQILSVDWTHPLLKVAVTDGLSDPAKVPEPWSRAEENRPQSLRIQLIEPIRKDDLWGLALELAPLASASTGSETTPRVVIGALFPWQLLGTEEEPRQALAPGPGSGLAAGLRWMGRGDELETMPGTPFSHRVLISWSKPLTGQTHFALVARTTPEPILMAELIDWLREQLGDGDRVALHATGQQAIVGMKDWRMTQASNPRRVERLGAILELSTRLEGDPVDWLRLKGSRIASSSREEGFSPDLVTKTCDQPDPLAPRLWVSQPTEAGQTPPWLLAEFDQIRPIQQVTMGWAQAAGWSAHFNPGRVRLQASASGNGPWKTLAVFEDIRQPVSQWRSDSPRPVRRLRLVFDDPSRMGLDTRARVTLWQAWGRWDGITPAGR